MDLSVHPDMASESIQEVFFRINELRIAFGNNEVDHFCTQIQDYIKVLLEREKSQKEYTGMSLIRHYRFNLIQIIMKVVELEGLTRATLHLAVYLFDRYQDFHNIPRNQLQLVIISCIIIAGKIEEKDSKTPKIKKLRKYLPNPSPCYAFPSFSDMELHILKYLEWSLIIPTAYTFMEFFLLFALDADEVPVSSHEVRDELIIDGALKNTSNEINDDHDANNNDITTTCSSNGNVNGKRKRMKILLEQRELIDPGFSSRNVNAIRYYALEVLDSLLYEEPDENLPPSLLAAGTLMFARRCYGFYAWTNRLIFTTTYSEHIVKKCCQYVEEKHITHMSLPIFNE